MEAIFALPPLGNHLVGMGHGVILVITLYAIVTTFNKYIRIG